VTVRLKLRVTYKKAAISDDIVAHCAVARSEAKPATNADPFLTTNTKDFGSGDRLDVRQLLLPAFPTTLRVLFVFNKTLFLGTGRSPILAVSSVLPKAFRRYIGWYISTSAI
jgi:hypothetical protein